MVTKRGTTAVKRGKRVKGLPAKSLRHDKAKGVKGGAQWGVGRGMAVWDSSSPKKI